MIPAMMREVHGVPPNVRGQTSKYRIDGFEGQTRPLLPSHIGGNALHKLYRQNLKLRHSVGVGSNNSVQSKIVSTMDRCLTSVNQSVFAWAARLRSEQISWNFLCVTCKTHQKKVMVISCCNFSGKSLDLSQDWRVTSVSSNCAPHADAREASQLFSSSQSRAGGRKR